MRSLLEKAIVHLLNEEPDAANALFHQFMVETARDIHEKIRNGEDEELDESWDDEISSNEYFAEDDLDGAEDTVGDEDGLGDVDALSGADLGDGDGLGDDVGGDVDDLGGDDLGDVDGDDGLDDGMGGDMADLMHDVVDGLGSIEDEIADLEAKFKAHIEKMDAQGGDDDMGDMDEGDDEFGDNVDGDGDVDDLDGDDLGDGNGDGDGDVDGGMGGDADTVEDEDLSDITESVLSELEKITVSMNDGDTVGDGGHVEQNRKSTVADRNQKPKPFLVKGGNNDSMARETAPNSTRIKTDAKNVRNKATDKMAKIPRDGDASAALNKDFAPGRASSKSQIAGK